MSEIVATEGNGVFVAQFKNPRQIDVSIQLREGDTIAEARARPEIDRIGRLFLELIALSHEDERLKALLEEYDIVVLSPRYTTGEMPVIHFETTKAKQAREASASGW